MNNENPNRNHYEEDGSDEFMDRQSSFSDVTHGSDSSSASASQPKKVSKQEVSNTTSRCYRAAFVCTLLNGP